MAPRTTGASPSHAGAARVSREVPYRMEAPVAPVEEAATTMTPRRSVLLEHLQGDITPAWWERVKGARATPEADIVPSAGPHPEMAARVARAAEANPRRTSLLDELQREEMSNPDIIRRRVTRAAGAGPPESPFAGQFGGTPAPSTNPLIDVLPPPEMDAWTALGKLKNRSEEWAPELDIKLPSYDPLARLDALRAQQMERYGRRYPFRPEN